MDSWLVQCFAKLNQMAEKLIGKNVNTIQKQKGRKHNESGLWNTTIGMSDSTSESRERYRRKKQMELKEKKKKIIWRVRILISLVRHSNQR